MAAKNTATNAGSTKSSENTQDNGDNTPPAAPVVAGAPILFLSPHGSLVIYHEGTKIATFEGGRFESDDAAVVAALRERGDLCSEWAGE